MMQSNPAKLKKSPGLPKSNAMQVALDCCCCCLHVWVGALAARTV